MELEKCEFERIPGGVRCRREGCGNVMRVPASMPLERCHATCRAGGNGAVRHRAVKQPYQGRNPLQNPCVYQGQATSQTIKTGGCGGGIRSLFECDVFGLCLPMCHAEGYHSCLDCGEYRTEDNTA